MMNWKSRGVFHVVTVLRMGLSQSVINTDSGKPRHIPQKLERGDILSPNTSYDLWLLYRP
jgi:hypothetical protein